jgi:LmbE family N-acetylglucosaminyl deacetylase
LGKRQNQRHSFCILHFAFFISPMLELVDQLDVIAVGAHPDDVEIGVGGTLAAMVRQGYRVGIIDLTDGEPTPASPGPEVRLAEAAAAAKALGVQFRKTLELPNRKLFDSFEARVALAKEFRRHRPRLVIGLGEKTPLASPDHWQAVQITDAAVFYSRLTKWDDQFDHIPPHIIGAQLYYTLLATSPAPLAGLAHVVSDISETLDAKIASVRCYATQFPPHKEHVFTRIRAMAEQHGVSAGFAAGELLASPRTLGTRDVMRAVFG